MLQVKQFRLILNELIVQRGDLVLEFSSGGFQLSHLLFEFRRLMHQVRNNGVVTGVVVEGLLKLLHPNRLVFGQVVQVCAGSLKSVDVAVSQSDGHIVEF